MTLVQPNQENNNGNQVRARRTLWLSLILGISDIITAIISAVSGLRYQANKNFMLVFIPLFGLTVVSFLSAYLSRRGKNQLGIGLIIGVILATMPIYPILIEGIGITIAIMVLVISLSLSLFTLEGKYINRVIIPTFIMGIVTVLVDLFGPFSNRVHVNNPIIIPLIIFVMTITFILVIVFQYRNLSLQFKIMVLIIGANIVTAAIIALYSINSSRDIATSSIGTDLKNQVTLYGISVGDSMARAVEGLGGLAVNSDILSYLNAANAVFGNANILLSEAKAEILELDQQWQQAYTEGDLQDPLVNSVLNNKISQVLQNYIQQFPLYSEINLINIYTELSATTRFTPTYYYYGQDWVKSCLAGYGPTASGNLYISVPHIDQRTGKYIVDVCLPIRDSILNTSLGAIRASYILAPMNTEKVHTQFDMLFVSIPPRKLHAGIFENVEQSYVDTILTVVKTDFMMVDFKGTNMMVSAAPVNTTSYDPYINQRGWYVIAQKNQQEILTPIQTQANTTVLLVVGILSITSFVGLAITSIITKPIQRLTHTASKIQDGDLSTRAVVNSKDEVGVLASTFNQMTDQLQETISSLEQRVTDRTRDLQIAAEISSKLSQVREIDLLLADAVDLINHSYNLYYVQIYLVNELDNTLELKAGSGEVGSILLKQGHRLSVNETSINGSAASQKKGIVVIDTIESASFRANPLLPDTRSEMAVPLLVGERVLGVLDMQSNQPGLLNEQNLPVFTTLAGQLGAAISNSELYQEAQSAREQLEAQARQLTRQGWIEFLNAVDRQEYIEYTYNDQKASTQVEQHSNTNNYSIPLKVVDQEIGSITLSRDHTQNWTDEEQWVITTVAEQVSRRVEALRLLAQAESYREASEEATRLLTRESWQSYLESRQKETSFVYDHHEVAPVNEIEVDLFARDAMKVPLRVRDEEIGEILVDNSSPGALDISEFISLVADRLSGHIETLRLNEQTQLNLSRIDSLYNTTRQLMQFNDSQSLLSNVVDIVTKVLSAEQGALILFDANEQKVTQIVRNGGVFEDPGQVDYASLWDSLTGSVLEECRPILLQEVTFNSNQDVISQLYGMVPIIGSLIMTPLQLQDRIMGLLTVINHPDQRLFSQQDLETAETIANQIAVALENQLLLEQTQEAYSETDALFGIITDLNAAMDFDDVLTAVRERTILNQADLSTILFFFDKPLGSSQKPEWVIPVASYTNMDLTLAERYPLAAFEAESGSLFTNEINILEDVDTDLRLDRVTQKFFTEVFKARSVVVVPLVLVNNLIGFVLANYSMKSTFAPQDIRRLSAVAGQAAISLQGLRLIEQSVARARREQMLRELTTQINKAVDTDSVMRRTVQELGNIIKKKTFVYLKETEESQENPEASSDSSGETAI
jgi:GAF domain-containing protein/HAMP domain-containing protein